MSRVVAAVWAVSLLLPRPGAAQYALGSGVNFMGYDFDAGLAADAAQLLMVPVALRLPFTDWLTIDLYSAWAEGRVERDGVESTLSGIVDTNVKMTVQASPWAVLSVGANLPTGETTHTEEEAIVASVLSTDLLGFREATWGTGFALTSSVATATTAGGFGIGVAGAYALRSEFEPAEGRSITYEPGNEVRVRVGIDRNFGGSTLTLGGTFIHYRQDESRDPAVADVVNLFQAGNRFRFDASLAFRAGDGVWTIYAADVIRENGDLFARLDDGSGSPVTDTLVTTARQNMIVGGVVGSLGLGGGFVVRPQLDFRYQLREEVNGNEAGTGWIFAGGFDIPLRVFGTDFFPKAQVRYGRVQDVAGTEVSALGLDVAGTLRWLF